MQPLPLISYYGDDFTGSTDVMEALSSNGIETVLFTRLPDEPMLARFAGCRAIGLAGTSRSRTPDWMDRELPTAFAWLASLGARFCHYKTCSTFDSSPERGSIGRAIEIGLEVFGQTRTPLVVGAPQLKRYTFAGHLFAGYMNEPYRIDRHPVMSCHPVTPMREADLLVHLAEQTALPSRLDSPLIPASAKEGVDDARIVLIDVHDGETQLRAGRKIEAWRILDGPLVAGSSGIEYALLAAWREAGEKIGRATFAPLAPADRMAVVSGSCSPTTARQIETACANGFGSVAIDHAALVSGQGREDACEAAFEQASQLLETGVSPIVHTALGPPTERQTTPDNDDAAGLALGHLLGRLKARHGLARIAVAGGDTSSHALAALDIQALTLRHPLPDSPGSPVCLGHPSEPGDAAVELILKGGQIGRDDYFVRLRDGNIAGAAAC
jgi:uncharacterized protein YgbK (DUF1537 family)